MTKNTSIEAALALLNSQGDALAATAAPLDGINVDALIAEAQGRLKVVVADEPDMVEAEESDVINALWARAEELKRTEDGAKRERAKITATMKAATPEGKTLTVHGAPVFQHQIRMARVLDQAAIRSEFPDIPGNERFYKDQITTAGTYKR